MPANEELAGWIDEREPRFVAIADAIWRKPEVALTESAACDLQARECAREGFTVTRDVGDMPTAFVAEWGSGRPIIGFLGGYDALPGLSQRAQAEREAIAQEGPGHGCGHNLLGTAAMAAAMVVRAWLERTDRPGTVRYYGCPAEETLAGKVYMARAGVFDDLDAAITWHPAGFNTLSRGRYPAIGKPKLRVRRQQAPA